MSLYDRVVWRLLGKRARAWGRDLTCYMEVEFASMGRALAASREASDVRVAA